MKLLAFASCQTKWRSIFCRISMFKFILSGFSFSIMNVCNVIRNLQLTAHRCTLSFKRSSSVQNVEPRPVNPHIKPWETPTGFDTGIMVTNCYKSLGSYSDRSLVPLIVKDPQNITWYSCGPTVYDDTHIGHAATYVRFDGVRRVLTNFFDYNVKMVMGITDVDDKLITRSLLLNKEMWFLAQHYETLFQRDMCNLNVLPPYQYMRVSELIPEMISFIEKLLKQGHAYITEGGDVWFDTNKFTDVGRLSILFEEYEVQASQTASKSKHRRDFALWKAAKPGEPYWDAPWGKGRPGWHLECSTMGSLVFGDNIDIHTGGKDLCFPHHECELLQSEAYHGCTQWVNYFFHAGHLSLKGSDAKMSKSLGNTVLVTDFLKKYSSDVFRYLVFGNSWNSDIQYEARRMERYEDFITQSCNVLIRCQNYINNGCNSNIDSPLIMKKLKDTQDKCLTTLKDNFKIGNCLWLLRNFEKFLDKAMKSGEDNETQIPRDVDCIQTVLNYMEDSYQKLGFLHINGKQAHGNSSTISVLKTSIEFRQVVRDVARQMVKTGSEEEKSKGKLLLTECSKVREEMKKSGVTITDGIETTEWSYKEKDHFGC